MIKQVISGGQIGADIAALRAARDCGIPTGGYAPKGFKTLHGPDPSLGLIYGLTELDTYDYPTRTFLNVESSDGTIRFAYNFNSPGERCTLKAINKYHKPYSDVQLFQFDKTFYVALDQTKDWINKYKIEILNVAGNARVDIEPLVERFIRALFYENI